MQVSSPMTKSKPNPLSNFGLGCDIPLSMIGSILQPHFIHAHLRIRVPNIHWFFTYFLIDCNDINLEDKYVKIINLCSVKRFLTASIPILALKRLGTLINDVRSFDYFLTPSPY